MPNDPVDGMVEVKAGGKAYKVRAGTRELRQLEPLFGVQSIVEVVDALQGASSGQTFEAAKILLSKHHAELGEEEIEAFLDSLSHDVFKRVATRCIGSTSAGAKGLKRVDDFYASLDKGEAPPNVRRTEAKKKP